MKTLSVIAEGESWLVIDKGPGTVVHDVPGEKHAGETVVDWLREHVPAIRDNFPADDARPGIVHRLDADTSGILLVAKTPAALQILQDQFRERTTEKTYHALVLGDPGERGTFIGAIGRVGNDTRHEIRRLSFSWDKDTPKPAETDWLRLQLFTDDKSRTYAMVELKPKTGRTHQLRVQLLDHDTPIIGDPMYSTKESREASDCLDLHRQFLHATSLRFIDPDRKISISVESELSNDLQETLKKLAH